MKQYMENAPNKPEYRKRWPLWLLLILLVVASATIPAIMIMPILILLVATSVIIVAIPVFVNMPFKPQSVAGVEWSYRLRHFSPLTIAVALILFLALCARLWHGSHWQIRLTMILLLALLIPVIWFSRQNYFEWAFRPLPNPDCAAIGEATFVSDSDMVLAVEINGDAVAYPVRHMAYHHLINDLVGGRPITATY
jgi:hypothetical protein